MFLVQPTLPLASGGVTEKDRRFVLDYPESELVFGLVFAVGTDYKPVLDSLTDHIKLSGYAAQSFQISTWFEESSDRLGLLSCHEGVLAALGKKVVVSIKDKAEIKQPALVASRTR